MQHSSGGRRGAKAGALPAMALFLVANAQAPDPTATPAPPLSTAERYDRADRYLGAELEKLIANGDVRATFTRDGAGILYRLGTLGQREIMYFALASGRSRAIIGEPALAKLLAVAIGEEVDPLKLRIEDPDYAAKDASLTFGVGERRWTLDAAGTLAEAKKGPPDGEGAVSPDGRYEILARDYNLVARDRKSGREVALTTDGTREQPYGRGIPQLADILKSGTPEPKMPVTWWVMVDPWRGTRKRFFLARSTPFWIASGTSLALP